MKRTWQSVRDSIDKLYSIIIRTKAQGRCELCHRYVGIKYLECHHIFGRGYSVRWLPEAGSAICNGLPEYGCHRWATDNSTEAKKKYRQIRGEPWWNKVYPLSNKIRQWRLLEMLELEKEFKRNINETNLV